MMAKKTEKSIQELENDREQLAGSLNLFALAGSEDAPAVLEDVALASIHDLFGGNDLPWGEEGLFPQSGRLIAEMKKSEEGRKRFLASDVEFLSEIRSRGTDTTHRAPLGLLEAAFPVVIEDEVVHVVYLGRVREEPFAEEELTEIARLSGLSRDDAHEMASSVPVLGRKELERAMAFCSKLRTALQYAIGGNLREAQVTDQLVQSERTHSLGTLSGGVAHHFNNLLSVILGYSSFVLNREKLSREAADAIYKITEAAQRGRRLTEEILAFLGSDVEEDVPCAIHETMNSVLSLLESKTGASVRVERNLEAENDIVLAEPSAIRQIVFNLLTNAIDSMPEGGVLTISTMNKPMATDDGPQEFFQLEVADSSGNLPPGIEGELDEAGVAEIKDATNRVGMKLSSVYGMVGRLDGTVVVSSDPGTTTRVQILLPVSEGDAKIAEEKQVRHRLAPSTIWVVDDDAIFREMCRQVLCDEGHSVEEVPGGKEFMELWRRSDRNPDLIIMDFSMPEYNGLQLTEWTRQEGSGVPVILVSGFAANQPDIKKALKLRKTFFLQKPFSFREMTDTVTVALGETLIDE